MLTLEPNETETRHDPTAHADREPDERPTIPQPKTETNFVGWGPRLRF